MADLSTIIRGAASQSVEELQKQLLLLQVQQQQQAIASGVQAKQQQAVQAQAVARQAAKQKQAEARSLVASYKVQWNQLNNLQNLTNESYAITRGTYEANIANMRTSLDNIVRVTNAAVEKNVGTARAQYGASDIIVDRGSARDVALQMTAATVREGNKNYSAMVNNISNSINQLSSLEFENKYKNLDFVGQKQILDITTTRTLNG